MCALSVKLRPYYGYIVSSLIIKQTEVMGSSVVRFEDFMY